MLKGWNEAKVSGVDIIRSNMYGSIDHTVRQLFKVQGVPFTGITWLEFDFANHEYKLEDDKITDTLKIYWRKKVA